MKDYFEMETLEAIEYNLFKEFEREREKLIKLIPQWTKFNHNDPKTFPPKNDKYLVILFGELDIAEWYGEYEIGFIKEGMKPLNDCISHWMAKPEMPKK